MAYTKQIWHDLPQTDTPINASRLAHIEDGIESVEQELKGTVLYNSGSGNVGNFTLNDSTTNYKYIEIHYKQSSWVYSKRFLGSLLTNGTSISLDFENYYATTEMQEGWQTLTVQSDLKTFNKTHGGWRIGNNTTAGIITEQTDMCAVFKVIGYKEV